MPLPLNAVLELMSETSFASGIIWLASLLLPLTLFASGNLSRSLLHNLLRAGLAVAAGWALTVALVIADQAMYISTATPSELLSFYDRDGAPRAFAAVLGWVPAAFLVAVAWLVRSLARRRIRHAH